ncbi:MAG: sulfurtransferase [Candidatus Bipolaricaulota bacterium]|nr:sulfurtransferase [Candidatus Bipolaricaulota bacterium]MCS7275371.1 sulfurtransferase [Candidatus Bipolaricaulota bacterium]MDW8110130.1 sulfurtransferase [Candidatus Bipolaricaulota bacterium]MDW8328950.1 sulfurtransferase [Candidatus Bipolaricaulota bacterium]
MPYARPDVLVETDWVAEHLHDPGVRIVESDEDVLLYEQGHIPGAVKIDWFTDLQHPTRRDFLTKEQFERLMSERGIANDTTVVFYGDKHNWYAAYSFWLFRYFGHDDTKLKIMNGGRKKWIDEGRPLTKEIPSYPKTAYRAQDPDASIRAFRDEVLASLGRPDRVLIDVRTPKEYTGELIHMPEYPQEGAQRGGHIPGALNIPWAQAVNPDNSTFKPVEELRRLYESYGITPTKDVIAYCRIGERSSHTWFVLTYLLGYPRVKNYDGSWTEWGNLVNVPIKKGAEP